MAIRSLSADLRSPDPIGRDLALYRTRVYRFSDDRRHYVLAEDLEERHIAGAELRTATMGYVRESLDSIRATGQVPDFDVGVAAREGIDVAAGLEHREPHDYRNVPMASPERVIAIVGAPRTGTSHLHNLLAFHGHFAHFTTVSCWAWPTRNLIRPGRRPFAELGSDVFAVDNKKTRLIPGLVMPYEAEDVFARALPAYRHVAGHRYDLQPAELGDLEILHGSAAAHLAHFGRRTLLVKSPFNSLRIPLLEEIWGPTITYVHITRDRRETANSIRRNHFEYSIGGQPLIAEEACSLFVASVEGKLPAERTSRVAHKDLVKHPKQTIDRLLNSP